MGKSTLELADLTDPEDDGIGTGAGTKRRGAADQGRSALMFQFLNFEFGGDNRPFLVLDSVTWLKTLSTKREVDRRGVLRAPCLLM